MTRVWILAGIGAIVALALSEWRRRQSARARWDAGLRLWLAPADVPSRPMLEAATRRVPRSASAWYLLGSVTCRERDRAASARYFGMAHHIEPDLPSAALLAFACLKSATDRIDQPMRWPLILATTWTEMGKPALGASRCEREIWRLLGASGAPRTLSPLGLVAWLHADPVERDALARSEREQPEWAAILFQAVTQPTDTVPQEHN